ncbi:MAG: hypothetical protein WBP81_15295, partial [Solirubrobacteraceae bacterium]
AVLFRLPGRLPAGTRVSLARAGRRDVRRLRESAWLYWADLQPESYFDHVGSLVVIAARSGRVLLHEPTLTWPVINGLTIAFLRSARAYNSRPYRVLARGSGASRVALDAPRVGPEPGFSGRAEWRWPVAYPAAGSAARCVIVVGPPPNVLNTLNPLTMFTWGGHLNDAEQMVALAQRIGLPSRRAYNLRELQDELASAPAQGCTDVLVFITGEGSPAPAAVPARLRGVLGGRKYFPVYGDQEPNIELAPDGRKITAKQLAAALKGAYERAPASAKPSYTLMIQECFAGRMLNAVGRVTGVSAVATSSSANTEASRYPSGIPRGASPWVNEMTDGILRAINATGKIVSWGDTVGQAFNGLPGSEDTPQLDVQGKILSKPPPPSCSAQDAYSGACQAPAGMVAVAVSVTSASQADPGATGSGTVEVNPPGRTVEFPLSASDGGPSYFYAREGSSITFTADRGPGSYLDGIQTQNGARCDGSGDDGTPSGHTDGGSPETCTFTVRGSQYIGTTYRYSATVRAFFYPCPPPPGPYARPGAMIDCQG